MEYRRLGNTDMMVSQLSYGAAPLGNVYQKVSEAQGLRTVHTTLELGINFIDVAPLYGRTAAESILGKALKGVPRHRYYLATKVGRCGRNFMEFDFSAEQVTASIKESMARLNVDYLDLIQCHDIEYGDLDQIVQETIPALRRLQASGQVRYIGITGLPLKALNYVSERTAVDTILSYCHYTLNDTTLEDALPFYQAKGTGVINASPLSMGLLTNRGAPDWHSASVEIREACTQAAAYCREQGSDIAKLAIQFSLANPDIPTTIVGTANPDNMISNVQWMHAPLNTNLLAEVQAILAPIKNKTWLTGHPENNE